jgi:hypothetical protein
LLIDSPIGQSLLALDRESSTCDIECPVLTIDLGEQAQFNMEPFQVTVQLPPTRSPLEIRLSFDEAYHLPFLVRNVPDSVFYCSLPPIFHRNIYILALESQAPVTIDEVLDACRSYQVPNATSDVDLWIVKRNTTPRTDLQEQRTISNQVRVAPVKSDPILELVACHAVNSVLKPYCPEHVGHMVRSPFVQSSKWHISRTMTRCIKPELGLPCCQGSPSSRCCNIAILVNLLRQVNIHVLSLGITSSFLCKRRPNDRRSSL